MKIFNMKLFIVLFVTALVSEIVSNLVNSIIGLDHNLFIDEFDLLLFIADFSIYLLFFSSVYTILNKLILKKD